MNEMRFPRWLAGFGVLGGVVIALGLPWLVLVHGGDLSDGAKLTLIILGLAAGSLMGIASAVVGITIPTAVSSGGLDLSRICCEPESTDSGRAAEVERES